MLAVGMAAVAQDRTRPDDPMFENQWGLENTGQMVNWTQGTEGADIDATRAWNLTTGSRSIAIAVVDREFDYKAEDLAANAWTNPDGVNGCPAGSHGYDVPSGDCNPNTDGGRHGTGMGYTIGAVSDNDKGLAGVNWTTSLMAVSAPQKAATRAEAINWVINAREAGVNVRVINASWGKAIGESSAVRSAIRRAGDHGILFVAGAGNAGEDNDANPRYPCNFDLSNLICVAASDQDDELAPRSNFGKESVHLAAPGHHICGGPKDPDCSGGTSTSDAAAYVSGVAALVSSYDPGLSVGEVRSKILGNVDEREALAGKVATGGRLNAYRAITGPASWTDPSENDDSGDADDGGGGGSGGSDGAGGGSDDTGPGDDGGGGSGGSDDGGSDDGDGSGGSDGSDDGDGGGIGSGGSDGGGSAQTGGSGSASAGSDGGGGRRTIQGGASAPGTGTDTGSSASSGDTGTSGGDTAQDQASDSPASEGGTGTPAGEEAGQAERTAGLDVEGAGQEPDDEGGSGTLIVGGHGDDTSATGDEGVSGWLWATLLAAGCLLALLARKPGGQAP